MKFEMLKYEYSFLKDLKHPNIIKVFKEHSFEPFEMIAMELSHGSLQDYV